MCLAGVLYGREGKIHIVHLHMVVYRRLTRHNLQLCVRHVKIGPGTSHLPSFYQFLPTRRYASAGNSDRNVSVRSSVSRAGIVSKRRKMISHDFMISSPSGSPEILVF